MPVPSSADDVLQLGILRLPTEFRHRLVGRGHEARRIAGATGLLNGGNALPGDLFAHLDDFADAVAIPVAEVEEARGAGLEREKMGLGDVDDVDVVADAGAVWRGIIGAEDLAFLGLSEGDLEHVGDQVRLHPVMFAEAFAGPGGVEVAEGDELHAVELVIPLEDLLEHQLGLAVGIHRLLRRGLVDGHAVRRAEGGAGGAEDEFLHPVLLRGVDEVQSARDIVPEILRGVDHRFADQRVRGEVDHGLGRSGLYRGEDVGAVVEIPLHKNCTRIDSRAVPLGEVVVDGDLMAGIERLLYEDGPDVSGATGDEDLHVRKT